MYFTIYSTYSHTEAQTMENNKKNHVETATFGEGCFWCVEAIFSRIDGVIEVKSGYSGGHVRNPTYKEVCTGTTGHAEVCQIKYNPEKVCYADLLEVFWETHDPTTLNRQGNDIGTQYRSVIFYHNEEQKNLAEEMKKRLDAEKIWDKPIVTEIVEYEAFYEAEDYHDDYFKNNPNQPYCTFVIAPKIQKFEKSFHDLLRKE